MAQVKSCILDLMENYRVISVLRANAGQPDVMVKILNTLSEVYVGKMATAHELELATAKDRLAKLEEMLTVCARNPHFLAEMEL